MTFCTSVSGSGCGFPLCWISWTFKLCLSIKLCKKRKIPVVRTKNVDCTYTHSVKNKIQRGALWCV